MDLTLSPRSFIGSVPPLPSLPDVTVVFISVASASSFVSKHSQQEVRALHRLLLRCMRQQLALAPGGDGYMCRTQDGDLKYMAAFAAPHRAVQWCLLVQVRVLGCYVVLQYKVVLHKGKVVLQYTVVLHSVIRLGVFTCLCHDHQRPS